MASLRGPSPTIIIQAELQWERQMDTQAPMATQAQTEAALMEMSPMVTQEPTGLKMATQMWVRTGTLLLPKVLRTMDTGRSTAMATAMTRWIPTGWTVDKGPMEGIST